MKRLMILDRWARDWDFCWILTMNKEDEMRKYILCSIFIMAFLNVSLADTTWVPAVVSGVWDSTGSPYILTQNTTIEVGCSLYIMENVKVVSDSIMRYINRSAKFVIKGSEERPAEFRNVQLRFPDSVSYADISEASLGVLMPLYVSHCKIHDCVIGIYNPRTVLFSEIYNCSQGITQTDYYTFSFISRTLFHHNNVTCRSDLGYGTPSMGAEFQYCTFESNTYSPNGASFRYWVEGSGDLGYWETASFSVSLINCLVCDPYSEDSLVNSVNSYNVNEGTWSADPCFIDTALLNYHLADTSPYINMADTSYGIPPDSFYGSAPDLGAFEYHPDYPIIHVDNLPENFSLSAHPNPFNSAVRIMIETPSLSPPQAGEMPQAEGIRVEIFDLNGRCIAQLPEYGTVGATPCGRLEEGQSHGPAPTTREFLWQPAAALPSGVYLVRARIEGRGDLAPTGAVGVKRVVYLE